MLQHSRGFIIIATGSTTYGNLSLNLCLSIRSNENIPVMLVCTKSAIKGIEHYVERYFTHVEIVKESRHPMRQASFLKLNAYQYAIKHFSECVLLDADTLILPGKKLSPWFEQKQNFRAYVHATFDYVTGESSCEKPDFWLEPLEVKEHFKIADDAIMPQINASFIFFRASKEAELVFDTALDVFADNNFPFRKFRGFKNEEPCFNVACAITKTIQKPYRPLYLQVFSETIDETYIQHRFTAFSMASDNIHSERVVSLYNKLCAYYRMQFGIVQPFIFEQLSKVSSIDHYVSLSKISRKKEIEIKNWLRSKKIKVFVVVYNRFENMVRWINCWNKCEQLGAELVVIHNYDTVEQSKKFYTYCLKNNVSYISRPNNGFDIGALQDVCKQRLPIPQFSVGGLLNYDYDIMFWATDDTIPMSKDFLYRFAYHVLNPAVGISCMHVSNYVKTHIRTTGICMRKEIAAKLIFPADPIITKQHCYEFEHKSHNSLINQIEAMNLKIVMPTSFEKAYVYDVDYLKMVPFNVTDRINEHEQLFPPNEDKKVTFICTVYNTFPEIVSSLICQTHKNWELILIHDGPNQTGLKSYIDFFKDNRIIYIETKKRMGVWGHYSRQWALKEISRGKLSNPDYIVIGNADNYLTPAYTEYMLNGFREGIVATYCGNFITNYASIQKVDGVECAYKYGSIDAKIELGFVDCMGVMVTKDVACEIGWPSLNIYSDWEYFDAINNKYGAAAFQRINGTLFIHN